jgi:hypothetical protein
LFLTVIPRGANGNHILLRIIAGKKAPTRNTCYKIGSPRFLWEYLLEIRFPKDYFNWEPYFQQSFPGEPRGTYFIAGNSTGSLLN